MEGDFFTNIRTVGILALVFGVIIIIIVFTLFLVDILGDPTLPQGTGGEAIGEQYYLSSTLDNSTSFTAYFNVNECPSDVVETNSLGQSFDVSFSCSNNVVTANLINITSGTTNRVDMEYPI